MGLAHHNLSGILADWSFLLACLQLLQQRKGYMGNNAIFFKIIYFLKDFIYLFWEGKGGRKRGRETSMCGCLLHTRYSAPGPATQACALTGNRTGDPLLHRLALDPLSHTSWGSCTILKPSEMTRRFCSSLAKASQTAIPNFNIVGKYNPSMGLEMGI